MARHVPHLLTAPAAGEVVPLSEQQLRHLFTVLRKSHGDPVTYTDGAGLVGSGRLDTIGIERDEERFVRRPGPEVTMAVVPLRDRQRNRFLVEKLAELGVAKLVWIEGRYAQAGPPPKARQWADQALEQSRGAWRMEITAAPVASLPGRITVCTADGEPWPSTPPRIIAIGPEGGWHKDDLPAGCTKISLGGQVLRTETAAVVAAGLALCGRPQRHDQ